MLRRLVRSIGLLAATLFLLLLGLWLASGWYWMFLSDSRFVRAHLNGGAIEMSFQQNYQHATIWAHGPRPNGQFPGFQRGAGWTFTWGATGSWWPATAAGPLIDFLGTTFIIALAGLLWPFRRRRRGHCQICDYNLTGNESGRCPECGTDAVAAAPPAV